MSSPDPTFHWKNARRLKTAFGLIGCLAIGSVRGEEGGNAYSVTTDFSYASQYVSRGVKLANDSFQPSVEAQIHDGYLGIWENQPIKRLADNETDFYGGYRYKYSPEVSLEGVATYYFYPGAKGSSTHYTVEAGFGATRYFGGVSGELYYYRDFKLSANTLQGTLGYSFALKRLGGSVDLKLIGGTVAAKNSSPWSEPPIRESYNYYGLDVSLPYRVSGTATVTLGVHWSHADGLSGNRAKDPVWLTAGFTLGL